MTIGASASAPTPQSLDNSTHTTHIKVQLQQAIDGMNIEYKNQEIHEGGYMSDSGLATPVSSARDVERVHICGLILYVPLYNRIRKICRIKNVKLYSNTHL